VGALYSPLRLPGLFYRAFVKDFVRIYRRLSLSLRLNYWSIAFVQVLCALAEILTLLLISLFAMSVAAPAAVPENPIIQSLLSAFPSLNYYFATPRGTVSFVSVLMIGAVLVKCLLSLLSARKNALFVERVNRDLSLATVKSFLRQAYSWHMTAAGQDAVLKIMERYFLAALLNNFLNFYGNVILCLLLFSSLAYLEPGITLMVVLVFGCCCLVLYGSVRLRLDKAGKEMYEADLGSRGLLTSLQKGVREIIIHRREELSLEAFKKIADKLVRPRAFGVFSASIPTQILEVTGFATIGLLVVLMLRSEASMEQVVATASMLMLTAWRILPAVNRCLAASVQIRSLRHPAVAYLDLADSLASTEEKVESGDAFGLAFQESLEFRGASFRYPGSEREALRDLNLVIKKGENLGVIGPSGSGKSTLGLLLTGLVPPERGRFLADGRALDKETREGYFRILGYVPQTPFLLDGTIAENIAFRDFGGEMDEKRIEECARLAFLDFIAEQPSGFRTELSSSAQTLSGGQVQRLALARALYPSPKILVLDEATSALDLAGESAVRKTVGELEKTGVTVVTIAHRLSAVEDCGRVIWLEDGRIKAEGPPGEILPAFVRDFRRKSDPGNAQEDPRTLRSLPDFPAFPEAPKD
jgi:ABC-type multidrug transport system fused ATPase/permease subunit